MSAAIALPSMIWPVMRVPSSFASPAFWHGLRAANEAASPSN